MERSARNFLLLLAGLVLSACGALTQMAYSNAAFAYSQLPPMLTWMVDGYVDMSGEQKAWMRDRVARIMEWHRSHELPEYRRFLERVLAETAEPFTVAEIGEAYGELRRHYRDTVEKVLPDAADFLLRLDAAQVAQMEEKFAEDNRKFVKESLRGTPAQRRAKRVKQFVGHLDGWLGSVTDAQREIVESFYADIPDLVEERLADRKVRHAETLALIRSKPSREQMIAGLRRLMVDSDSWRRPEFLKKLADRDQRFFELLSKISATLSAEQRAHLQKRIRSYMRDIGNLTAERAN
jgi:uncharacterized membrane-anchored protein YhcB (DUF1043 family)